MLHLEAQRVRSLVAKSSVSEKQRTERKYIGDEQRNINFFSCISKGEKNTRGERGQQ